MLRRNFTCQVALACGSLVAVSLTAWAGDKPGGEEKSVLSGVWVQKLGELKLDYSHKDLMKIFPHGDNAPIAILCDCTVGEDGLVKAKISGYEGTEDAKEHLRKILPLGLEFRFTWRVKDGLATLAEVQGGEVDVLKAHLESEYTAKQP